VHQKALTDSALHGWPLGDADFVKELINKTTRRVLKSVAGRPPLIKK